MGYQVGNHCYATKNEAENVYFSLVAPKIVEIKTEATTITRPYPYPSTTVPAGTKMVLMMPEFKSDKWYFNGQIVTANLPHCDEVKNFKEGQEIGWLIFSLAATCYVFVIIKRLLS